MVNFESEKDRKHYLTTGEAAAFFGVTVPTIRTWIRKGVITAFQTPGGHSRIIAEDFFHLLPVGHPGCPLEHSVTS